MNKSDQKSAQEIRYFAFIARSGKEDETQNGMKKETNRGIEKRLIEIDGARKDNNRTAKPTGQKDQANRCWKPETLNKDRNKNINLALILRHWRRKVNRNTQST